MPTNPKTKARRTAQRKSRSGSAGGSALTLLKQDHREVEDFFERYEELDNDRAKAELARQICNALNVPHADRRRNFLPGGSEGHG